MRILLIEADPAVARRLEEGLRREGLVVRAAAGAPEGVRIEEDVVLIGLPDADRLALCRSLRARDPRCRIVMLTPEGSEPHVVALEAGADDALGRDTASPRELAVRLRAVGRRRGGVAPRRPPPVSAGALTVDPVSRRVELDGVRIRPSPTELELLLVFAASPGRVIDRATLSLRVWSDRTVDARTLDSAVKRLRARLGEAGGRIETVRGIGYRFRADVVADGGSEPGSERVASS